MATQHPSHSLDNALQHAFRKKGLAPQRPPVTAKPPKQQPAPAYRYRGLPCSITSDEKLWFVEGVDARGGSGVLEWCYDKADATDRLAEMRKFPQFSRLAARKFGNDFSIHHLVAEQLQ